MQQIEQCDIRSIEDDDDLNVHSNNGVYQGSWYFGEASFWS